VRQFRIVRLALLATSACAALAGAAAAAPQARPGWPLYDRYCLACHGVAGDGQGPAAPFTRSKPRDLTRGDFAWRTTPLGQPPTDDDLRLVIRRGAPGTSMPGFDLAPAQIDQLVDVVKAFAPTAFVGRGAPISLGAPPPIDAERGARLWGKHGCDSCHGVRGDADTGLAKTMPLPPYDLTPQPLHRPRAADDPASRRTAAALSIYTGLAHSIMPGYGRAGSEGDVWALADHVLAIGARARDDVRLSDRSITNDHRERIGVGTWPARGDDAVVFGSAIAPQGPPPPALAPAQASLAARQCARCHAKQYREWQPSRHAGAVSPGVAAQMFPLPPDEVAGCLRCHAPLAEQQTDRELRDDAVVCAGCHVRGWTRHGPPNPSPTLLPIAGYPAKPLAIYERADLCLPCHQLPPRTAVGGKPLLDTYREWLEGPYMRRGVQCQHCHMPNREHTFLGVHDPETFRQGVALTASAHAHGAAVTVVAELANVGAGHYLPTTPTPAVWLQIELRDRDGRAIAGATSTLRIGRDVHYANGWQERSDTRIAPGARATMARGWTGGRTPAAATARITVDVHPDDYYERLYERRLAGPLEPARRRLYEEALARGRSARYTAITRDVPIAR
jgi:hypothetical protein